MRDIAGLEIRPVPIDSLHQDPANARAHGEDNLDAIVGSLARFGQAEPLVVQSDTAMVEVTLKLVDAARLEVPEAVMVSRLRGADGMVTSVVQTPWSPATTSRRVRLSPTTTVTRSPALTPEPVTRTIVPGGPPDRSRPIPAPTSKVTAGTLDAEVTDPEART